MAQSLSLSVNDGRGAADALCAHPSFVTMPAGTWGDGSASAVFQYNGFPNEPSAHLYWTGSNVDGSFNSDFSACDNWTSGGVDRAAETGTSFEAEHTMDRPGRYHLPERSALALRVLVMQGSVTYGALGGSCSGGLPPSPSPA